MSSAHDAPFPLPFPSLGARRGQGNAPYIVGAMFTANYADKAARLAASCEKFSLPYDLHEVPTVHRSMSAKGSDDLRFTKANFIHHLLRTHDKPVVYLDADCEFVAEPHLLKELARSRCDFAIYNWLADKYTDRFHPLQGDGVANTPHRYFRYTGSIDRYSTGQLIAAGLTQFYGNSMAARALLARWHRTVAAFPGCGDDNCLNYTYNNLSKWDWLYWLLKKRWLPKPYARVMYWIYAEPVINHPQILSPNSDFVPIRCPRGRKEIYRSMTETIDVPLLFPRDCIIDTKEGMLCKLVEGSLIPIEKTPHKFWV
jgi:hypothetical protein